MSRISSSPRVPPNTDARSPSALVAFLVDLTGWMDGGWLPSTLGLPPPIKRHATPKPPTEARQHNEHGVTVVPGELGSVRLDVKNAGSRNKPKELRLKFFANHDPGQSNAALAIGQVGNKSNGQTRAQADPPLARLATRPCVRRIRCQAARASPACQGVPRQSRSRARRPGCERAPENRARRTCPDPLRVRAELGPPRTCSSLLPFSDYDCRRNISTTIRR